MSDRVSAAHAAGAGLESFGRALVERFGPLNFWTAALLVAALVLDRALARRTRASWRVALYAPVGLRVLLPLDWSIHLASAPRVDAFFAPLAQMDGRPAATLAAWNPPSWLAIAAVVYVAVAGALATRAVVARVRLGRALVGARSLARVDVPCSVLEHDDLGPMVVGLVAQRIVLPRRLLAASDQHALACVLRHEIAHLRRGDAWLSATMQVLIIVAWPVVPLWIAVARVRRLMELACDEAALADADAAERRRYGHALLDMAEWQSFTVAPLGAGALHFGSTLRARVEALAAERHWPVAAQALALSIAPIALLAACGGPARSAAAPPESGHDAEGYGYEFEADSAKAAAAPGASPSPTPDLHGRLPPETIQATVRASFGALKVCYEAGLARNAKLTGTVAVKYVIAEDGSTIDAADEKSTLPDKGVVDCIVGELRKLTYPKPQGGRVTVVYPILFAP